MKKYEIIDIIKDESLTEAYHIRNIHTGQDFREEIYSYKLIPEINQAVYNILYYNS